MCWLSENNSELILGSEDYYLDDSDLKVFICLSSVSILFVWENVIITTTVLDGNTFQQ